MYHTHHDTRVINNQSTVRPSGRPTALCVYNSRVSYHRFVVATPCRNVDNSSRASFLTYITILKIMKQTIIHRRDRGTRIDGGRAFSDVFRRRAREKVRSVAPLFPARSDRRYESGTVDGTNTRDLFASDVASRRLGAAEEGCGF